MASSKTDRRLIFECPVCFCLPKGKLYQCKDGHVLCKECYSHPAVKDCPECREKLDKKHPIRNLQLEKLLDGAVFNCKDKGDGCVKNLNVGAGTHESKKQSCDKQNKINAAPAKTANRKSLTRRERKAKKLQRSLEYSKMYIFGMLVVFLFLGSCLSYAIFVLSGNEMTPVSPNRNNSTRGKLLEIWNTKEFQLNITEKSCYIMLEGLLQRRLQSIANPGEIEIGKEIILKLAAAKGDVNSIKYLIQKGLNVNEVSKNGWSLLHWTMFDRNKQVGLEKAKLLVNAGADFQAKNFKNQTILHFAAWWNDPESCEYFVELGLDVDAVDIYGNTPLHLATEQEYPLNLLVWQKLIKLGADQTIKNSVGATPLKYLQNDYLTFMGD